MGGGHHDIRFGDQLGIFVIVGKPEPDEPVPEQGGQLLEGRGDGDEALADDGYAAFDVVPGPWSCSQRWFHSSSGASSGRLAA